MRNSKLDSFLKRNTDRAVYERIRAYEPCVVVSESIDKVYMYVVLTDECVYLTEYHPRTLTAAVNLRHIRDIELINDLPGFLSGKAREHSQHTRITYTTTKHAGKKGNWLTMLKRGRLSGAGLPTGRNQTTIPPNLEENRWSISPAPLVSSSVSQRVAQDEESCFPSYPSPTSLGHSGQPWSPPALSVSLLRSMDTSPNGPEVGQAPRGRGRVPASVSETQSGGGGGGREDGEREAEIHLYAVSPASHMYLLLQSSWEGYVMRSTLMLDPLYRRRCSVTTISSPKKHPPTISWERTAQLFGQLSAELLHEDQSLESLYLLLQELRTAALRSVPLRRLFWRSSDVFLFLVQTLEHSLQGPQSSETSPKRALSADQLLLCTLIAQTLALMFRETDVEPARLSVLTDKQGVLTAQLLLALVRDPELHAHKNINNISTASQLQALLSEYQDAACSLLFELVTAGQEATRRAPLENFLTVGWLFTVLQPHPHLLSFIGHQARQLALVLSDPEPAVLSPAQSVLLAQRCRVLLSCLQHSHRLAWHLRTHFGEEFRYYVRLACVVERLPPHYPISRLAQCLVSQLAGLMLQR